MINLKNIVKMLLVALFICAYSGESWAQDWKSWYPVTEDKQCPEGQVWYSPDNSCRDASGSVKGYSGGKSGAQISEEAKKAAEAEKAEEAAKETKTGNSGQDATFCGSEFGVFNELVTTGQKIFKRLRDLIYVVAGFGIIAVAVGGFFGNLNWKWLGAIVISLVVVATAGELVVLMTGCEQFSASLVTNTLSYPTQLEHVTENYNTDYTVSGYDSATSSPDSTDEATTLEPAAE